MLLPLATGIAVATDDRTQLEDAVILMLQPLHEWHGGPVERISSYAGEFNRVDEEMDRLLGQLLQQRPALLVAAGETRYRRDSAAGKAFKANTTLYVMVVSGHLRSTHARNSGGDSVAGRVEREIALPSRGGDPGAFRLMAAVRDLLNTHDLAIDNCGAPELESEEVMFSTAELVCWRMTFNVERAETTRPIQEFLGRRLPYTSHETRGNLPVGSEMRPVAVALLSD